MGILIFLIVGYILLCYGLSLLFPLSHLEKNRAWIPGFNFGDWCEMVGRKRSYAWWFLFPIVNIFTYANLAVETVRSFGKYKFLHSFLAVVFGPIYFIILGQQKTKFVEPAYAAEKAYKEKVQQLEKENKQRELQRLVSKSPYSKSKPREWAESLIFAVFAASFIRMFLIEAYNIPTSSMEDSLLVGDFLFVSKVHYGLRTPQTVASFPLLHNRIPFVNTESYFKWPQLPYFKFPAIETKLRDEAVVFNWPVGDSIFITPQRTVDIGQARRSGQLQEYQKRFEFVTRPMDKTDFYVKRCVGQAGDTLEIRNREVFINGEKGFQSEGLQYNYLIRLNGQRINTSKFSEWNISSEDVKFNSQDAMFVTLTEKQKERLQAMAPKANFEVVPPGKMHEKINTAYRKLSADHYFPHDSKNFPNWTADNFGPIYIPKKGATINISKENIALYKRIIDVYEDNDLEIKGNDIFINGEKQDNYTFKYDYFWMMGDNRHNSEDSRIWGFVPETHIVGKPLFIFFSTVEGSIFNGIRWNRIFSSANLGPEDE